MPEGNPLGYSFQPQQTPMRSVAMQGRPAATLSPAIIKLLSLRVPQRETPGALAPQALLNAPGGGGGGPNLNTMLMALMRAFAPQAAPSAPAGVPGAQGVPERRPSYRPSMAMPGPMLRPQPSGFDRSTQPVPTPQPTPPRFVPGGVPEASPPLFPGGPAQPAPFWPEPEPEPAPFWPGAPDQPIPAFEPDLPPLF